MVSAWECGNNSSNYLLIAYNFYLKSQLLNAQLKNCKGNKLQQTIFGYNSKNFLNQVVIFR